MIVSIFNQLKRKPTLYFLLMISILSSVLGVFVPFINGSFVDVLISAESTKSIVLWATLLLLIGITNIIVSYAYNVAAKKFTNKISTQLIQKTINHVWHLSYTEILKYNLAYLMQRIYTDSNIIITFFMDNFFALIINAFTVMALIVILWEINKYYLLISVIFTIFYAIAFIVIKKNLSEKALKCKNSSNVFYSVLNTQLSNFEDIKIEVSFETGNKIIKNSFNKYWKDLVSFLKISQKTNSIDGIISLCFQVTSFLIGGFQVITGSMTIGEYTIVNSYFTIMLSCIKYYFNFAKSYQETKVSYKRLDEIFSTPTQNYYLIENNIEKVNTIQLKGVCFKYADKLIIDNIDSVIDKGDIVSIVGKNGTGKSTLLKILIGLLELDSGEILIDNISYKELNWNDFRSNTVAVATQTLACEQVMVSEFVANLDIKKLNKYFKLVFNDEHFIDNNLTKSFQDLSCGEKSKLLVVRALSKETPIILFDEPTANMDFQSSKLFVDFLLDLNQKIVICSTHDEKIIEVSTKKILL